jgi:hypothetical protein
MIRSKGETYIIYTKIHIELLTDEGENPFCRLINPIKVKKQFCDLKVG